MTQVPSYLQDASTLLTEEGFATGDIWYHGTSSALLESIKAQGLKRSGDHELQQAMRETMATIGHSDAEQPLEPVFLTQSRELAFYWAQQCVARRRGRFDANEQPVVIALKLDEDQCQLVKPDVGAAAMLIARTDEYFSYLESLYQTKGLVFPELHPTQTDRADYLSKLGMAYLDQDVEPAFIELVEQ